MYGKPEKLLETSMQASLAICAKAIWHDSVLCITIYRFEKYVSVRSGRP